MKCPKCNKDLPIRDSELGIKWYSCDECHIKIQDNSESPFRIDVKDLMQILLDSSNEKHSKMLKKLADS